MTNYIEAGKLQYKPAEIAGVRIVIWKTKTARKKEKNRPAEDMRVLGALGVVFQKNRKKGTEIKQTGVPELILPGQDLSDEDCVLSCPRPDPEEWSCARTELGKPYFIHHPELHFSLSDSGKITAVAFSEQPAGLDIQLHQRRGIRRTEAEDAERLSRLARRFYHPEECDFVLSEEKGRRERFYRVWTAKEAYVKYTGQGIDGMFAKISVKPEGKDFPEKMRGSARLLQPVVWQALGCTFCCCEPEEGLSLCLCRKQPYEA